jgi:hypothetical protein
MGFTRTSKTEGAYRSTKTGASYRLLATQPDGEGTWMVIADSATSPQPTHYAVRQSDGYGREVRRGARDGELVGYAENLADMAWPVERDLIKRGISLVA